MARVGKGLIQAGRDCFAYLGHFRNPRFLKRGHNVGVGNIVGNMNTRTSTVNKLGGSEDPTGYGGGIGAGSDIAANLL